MMQVDNRVQVLEDTEDVEEMNNKGKEEVEQPVVPEKTFLERLADLVSALRQIDGYSEHDGLKSFETVVVTTNDKKGEERENLESNLKKAFTKFYDEHREDILKEKFGFLLKDDDDPVTIAVGRRSKLPLSEIYGDLYQNSPELITNIEACIFFVCQHICPDEDLERMVEICNEFEPQQSEAPKDILGFIGNIIGTVSEKVSKDGTDSLETEDGQIDTKKVGNVVVQMLEDGDIGRSMQNMLAAVGSEDFDLNSTMAGLLGGKFDLSSFGKK